MKNLNYFTSASASRKWIVAALCLGGLAADMPLRAQCGFELTGVITQPNCGSSDGMIELLLGEGVQVYSIFWSTGDEEQLLTGLADGYYSVTIMDWDGCSTTADFLLSCDDEDVGDEGGDVPIDDDCTLKTYTQGGWGSPANGNNPGSYRNANFAGAFPNGLTIGCDRTLTLTSATAAQAFLPSGSTPRMLGNGSMVDPSKKSYKNVLAGQLIAATLNVGMDAYDAGFAPSNNLLGNATITSGPFQGTSVQQLLDMANAYIGGCGGSYSASQYNDALSAINENFVDGSDNGFLSCGGVGPKAMTTLPMVTGIFPNPASTDLIVRLELTKGSVVTVELFDLTGRVAAPKIIRGLDAGPIDHTLDVSTLGAGIYFLRISTNGEETTTRVVVSR